MNITYRSQPILKYIDFGNLSGVGYEEKNEFIENIKWMSDLWKLTYHDFANIRLLSLPFAKAWIMNMNKVDSLIDDDLYSNIEAGTIIIGRQTQCFSIQQNKKKNKEMITIFVFSGNVLTCCIQKLDNRCLHYISPYTENFIRQFLSYNDIKINNQKELIKNTISFFVGKIGSILSFIKYAPIELKTINKNSKLKDFHCKYNNQTNNNILIIDSSWFTTTIRNLPFNVRGHFRLQRCGHGLRNKKIVWIEEFQKSGYKRKFKRPITKYDLIFGKPNIN